MTGWKRSPFLVSSRRWKNKQLHAKWSEEVASTCINEIFSKGEEYRRWNEQRLVSSSIIRTQSEGHTLSRFSRRVCTFSIVRRYATRFGGKERNRLKRDSIAPDPECDSRRRVNDAAYLFRASATRGPLKVDSGFNSDIRAAFQILRRGNARGVHSSFPVSDPPAMCPP